MTIYVKGAHNFVDYAWACGGSTYSYTGSNVGVDSVMVEFEGASAYENCESDDSCVWYSWALVRAWTAPPPPPPTIDRTPRPVVKTLAPASEVHDLNQTAEVSVQVKDQFGEPWNGTLYWSTAYFDVLSANIASGNVQVSNGLGTFSYIGRNPGEDRIVVGDGRWEHGFGVASRTWRGPKPKAQIITQVSPPLEVNPARNYTDFEVLVRDEDGNPWTGVLAWSTRYVVYSTSTNTAAGMMAVDNGKGTFGYTGAVSGEDIITVGVPGVPSTFQEASRTWTDPGPDPCDLVPLDANGQILPTGCDSIEPVNMFNGLVEATTGACEGIYEIGDTGVCTHGPDLVAATALGALDELVTTVEESVPESSTFGPAAPSNLTATAVSAQQVNLAWSDNSGDEEGFFVERSTDGGSSWFSIAAVEANMSGYSVTGLYPESTYFYRVRSYNSVGRSGPSNTATATTPAEPVSVPAAPGALTTSPASSSEIALSWTDNSANEDGFKIERSSDGGVSWADAASTPANVYTFVDAGRAASTTYAYRVRAHNAAGNSGYSNTATATTYSAPLASPSPPSALAASSMSSSEIALSWTDNSGNEDRFTVERSSDGGVNWAQIATLPQGSTTFRSTGLMADTNYHYRVAAHNGAGASSYSNVSWARTMMAPSGPPQPTYNGYEEEPGYDETSDSDYAASVGYGTDPSGTAAAEAGAINTEDDLCKGDGRSGYRVQAVYAVAKNRDSRYLKVRGQIRAYAHSANRVYFKSSAENNRRKIRFVCNDNQKIAVRKIVIPADADEALGKLFPFLRGDDSPKGMKREDRKYLIWVDRIDPSQGGTLSSYTCGLGEVSRDKSRNGPNNTNNAEFGYPHAAYAAVYLKACAGFGDSNPNGNAESHELMHTLGGVHRSAPHGTFKHHCSDEWDVMCYDDSGPDDGKVSSHGKDVEIAYLCKPRDPLANRFDCNGDDYYNSRTNLSGYLAEWWNTADSRFLVPNT